MNFKTWLRSNLTVAPNPDVDARLLNEAKKMLRVQSVNRNYLKPLTVSVCSILIIITLIIVDKNNNSYLISKYKQRSLDDESIEMLLNYNQMELMADASSLDENDWNKIK